MFCPLTYSDSTLAQAVSHWPLTTEAWVSPCGICGGRSVTVTRFSQSSLIFPLSISFHRGSILMFHVGNELVAAVQRHNLTTMNNNYKDITNQPIHKAKNVMLFGVA
jgi:hypothetical protein